MDPGRLLPRVEAPREGKAGPEDQPREINKARGRTPSEGKEISLEMHPRTAMIDFCVGIVRGRDETPIMIGGYVRTHVSKARGRGQHPPPRDQDPKDPHLPRQPG